MYSTVIIYSERLVLRVTKYFMVTNIANMKINRGKTAYIFFTKQMNYLRIRTHK